MNSPNSSLIVFNMNNEFNLLEKSDDVIRINNDTFTVSRLKELLCKEIALKLRRTSPKFRDTVSILSEVSIGKEIIKINEIQVNTIIACHILQVGGKSWEKGNLKIQVNKSIVDNQVIAYLEFFPDQPNDTVGICTTFL